MWDAFRNVVAPDGNWWRPALFFIVVLVSLTMGRLARFFMSRSASAVPEERRTPGLVLLKALAKPVMFIAFAMGWCLGAEALKGPSGGFSDLISTLSEVIIAVSVGYTLYCLVDVVDYYLHRLAIRTESRVDDVLAPLVGKSVRITILVIATLNVIQVLSGKSVGTILAGLGIGGLAIALAGQDTVRNFFGSIVILGDKPFEIGDRIVIEGHDGPVESVGFRSTKIRTLSGHLVTVPNSEMVNKVVENIGRRPYIRRVFNVAVTYGTSPDKMKRAIEILRDILHDHEGMHPDFPPRVCFSDFTDWALNILVIYWYHPPDYWRYMAFTEQVNLRILERFNAEGIDFAFPTQTVCLDKDDRFPV